jgi:phosphatidylserine decarboxylase
MNDQTGAKLKDFPVSVRTFAAAQLLRVLPRAQLSQAVGRLCERPLSPKLSELLARAYCKAYRVSLEETLQEDWPYPSFDAFFTRKLREGCRIISSDPLVSPADGRLNASGPIDSDARILVKGRSYDVGELIGSQSEVARYRGGSFAVVYLHPSDYHRVHSPVDGQITLVRGIPGDYYPVNALGERHVPRLLVLNNRVVFEIDAEQVGKVGAVMVGATIVGRITVSGLDAPSVPPGDHVLSPPVKVKKGDEIGVFHLGSTVVLLLPPGTVLSRPAGLIRYGESLVAS